MNQESGGASSGRATAIQQMVTGRRNWAIPRRATARMGGTGHASFPAVAAARLPVMALSPLLAASVAVVPGIHAWWTGRTLIARTADPAFPELLLARSQKLVA